MWAVKFLGFPLSQFTPSGNICMVVFKATLLHTHIGFAITSVVSRHHSTDVRVAYHTCCSIFGRAMYCRLAIH